MKRNLIIGSSIISLPIIYNFNNFKTNNNINNENNKNKENLIIVGNGYASHYLQKNIDNNKYNKKIISNNKNTLHTPELVKSLYKDKLPYLSNNIKSNEFINDKIINLNFENKELEGEKGVYNYDKVVFCVGSETNDFNINGVKEYAFKFKTEEDRNKLKEKLKDEIIKNIVIIGSGAVGVELASLLNSKGYKITIIEGMKEILPGYNNNTKEEIEKYLEEKEIKLIKENFVKEINETKVKTNKNEFDYDLVIWSGGIKFNGYENTILYKTLKDKAKITPRGINVNDDFSIDNDIYILGDSVANKGPPTAQNAKNQALWLSKYLNDKNNNKKIENFKVIEKGKLLHLENKVYIESKYYNGYIIKSISYIIDYLIKIM